MSLFDEIKTGLNEAIEYEKGCLKAKTTTLSIFNKVRPIFSHKLRNCNSENFDSKNINLKSANFND